jgi:hypothetical protein
MSEDNLTIRILRELQTDLRDLREVTDKRFDSLDEKADVTNERLSMVERATTFMAAQINVMRRHVGIEERKTDEEIDDLKARVSKLEDLVKP